MSSKSDEQVLYECYMKLNDICARKTKRVLLSEDRKMVSGIISKLPEMIFRLGEDSILTAAEIQENLCKAKKYIFQMACIKNRNSSCVGESLIKSMERLVRAVCKREADMIWLLRIQETGGERIDLETIFENESNISKLGVQFARDIVRAAMKESITTVGRVGKEVTWYITETGKKYHVKGCAYCKGRNLIKSTTAMIKLQKLDPCKCVDITYMIESKDCVTVFIDESIHPVKWGDNGTPDKTSSFSYIICRGNLPSENYIDEDNIITKGVDYCTEKASTTKVTETAIGKVMLLLLYNHNFTGDIQIYTDNKTVLTTWSKVSTNLKIAKQFNSVTVKHISRENNKAADALGREKMFLCIPTDVYNSIVAKNESYDELKCKYENLLTEKRNEEEVKLPIVNDDILKKITGWLRNICRRFTVDGKAT